MRSRQRRRQCLRRTTAAVPRRPSRLSRHHRRNGSSKTPCRRTVRGVDRQGVDANAAVVTLKLGQAIGAPAEGNDLEAAVQESACDRGAESRGGAGYEGGAAFFLAQTVCGRWMADGTAAKIIDAKRIDAVARQKLARHWLGRFGLIGNRQAYHCWLPLPGAWRADAFVAAAARHHIAVTPASAFAVTSGHAPNAVRLVLSAPPTEILSEALETLASILDGGCDAPPPVE